MLPGSAECLCVNGYEMEQNRCVDINECASNPCDRDAQCSNNAGSFSCRCNAGFRGNGRVCEDENECLLLSGKQLE